MLKINHYSFSLPFQYPFTISKGTKTHQNCLVVSLETPFGKGFGESPAINYYQVTVPDMIAILEQNKAAIERYAFNTPERFWHFLHHLIPNQNFLINALDMAAWDMYGHFRKKPLHQLLGLNGGQIIATDYTIGIDITEKMIQKLIDHPWNCYKIKMGSADDIDHLIALRAHTDKPFRVDANEGWNYNEALKLIPELKKLGVSLVEQPLNKNAWEEMKDLKLQSNLPLIADEACVIETDVIKCVDCFDGINIKLTKCGGLTPAIRMIKQAQQLNLKIMVGSMNESSIGTAAMVHLSPFVDYLDADGPLLLTQDLATGLRLSETNNWILPTQPGLGIQPNIQNADFLPQSNPYCF